MDNWPMNNDKIFVVAGTLAEFKQFMHKKLDQLWKEYSEQGRIFNLSMSNFVYVSSIESLAGHRNIHGYFYGSFRNRPDLKDIVRHIRLRNGLPEGEQLIPDLYIGRGMHRPLQNPTMIP